MADVGSGLACPAGHRFDAARQGYVHLAVRPIRHPGDTADMVAARGRVQAAGLFDPLTAALADAVRATPGVVLDLGAGTGHHLAGVLDRIGGRSVGIALDTSKYALRRAARAHPLAMAIAADATDRLPIADGAVDAVLIAFAPRAADELARVVRPGGVVVVATPTADHLAELREPLGMLAVGEGKEGALTAALAPAFGRLDVRRVREVIEVDRATAADLALMGPAGFHATAAALQARAALLPQPVAVTLAVDVTTFGRP